MMAHRRTGQTRAIAALTLSIGAAFSAWAAPIPVANPSFEAAVLAPGTFSTTSAPPGWVTFGAIDFGWRVIGVLNPNSTTLYADPVPDGSNVGVVFLGPSFGGSPAGLQQVLATNLQPRTRYILSVDVGNIANDPNPPHSSFNFAGFPGYRIELRAGTNLIAAAENAVLPGEGRFVASAITGVTSSVSAGLGQPLAIRLINLDQAGGIEVNFDRVQLDAVALPRPEVATLLDTNGTIRISFIGLLEESDDLESWTPVVPLPVSPLAVSPTGPVRFYRSLD
jgi:hypothetical protein